MRTPVELLPLLAHAYSVDIWNPKWPEHKQRRVVGDAVYHHRIKGTLAGLEAYAAIVDSEVIRAITPPGTFFCQGHERGSARRTCRSDAADPDLSAGGARQCWPENVPVGPRLFRDRWLVHR